MTASAEGDAGAGLGAAAGAGAIANGARTAGMSCATAKREAPIAKTAINNDKAKLFGDPRMIHPHLALRQSSTNGDQPQFFPV
jgi:hypothetical protein